MTNEVEDLYLKPWEEILGICIELDILETGTIIILQTDNRKYRLNLPLHGFKPEELQQQPIAVLKTGILEKPFLLRRVNALKNRREFPEQVPQQKRNSSNSVG